MCGGGAMRRAEVPTPRSHRVPEGRRRRPPRGRGTEAVRVRVYVRGASGRGEVGLAGGGWHGPEVHYSHAPGVMHRV